MGTTITCLHQKCLPETHPRCSDCKNELQNRWDCKSGKGMLCRQCLPAQLCEDCCKKDPKMEWETFHNTYIEKFSPTCFGCGGVCYESEGHIESLKGKIIAFCSSSCWEEKGSPGEWRCAGHPPVELLEQKTDGFEGTITVAFTLSSPSIKNKGEALKLVKRLLKSVKNSGGVDFTEPKIKIKVKPKHG